MLRVLLYGSPAKTIVVDRRFLDSVALLDSVLLGGVRDSVFTNGLCAIRLATLYGNCRGSRRSYASESAVTAVCWLLGSSP